MNDKPALRRGWTTGACAAAAACAAYEGLNTGRFPDPVTISLPKGLAPSFPLAMTQLEETEASAGVVKDAGDDPDVTHGALVVATARKRAPGSGFAFVAGEGVGTVTKPGLALAVGEPAINPAPRRMIRDALARAAVPAGADMDVEVEISIPGGAALAEKTLNPRLGIVGGLSILGTTGVVVPYSASAWIHSLHRGVDVALACGHRHLAACTGAASEAAAKRMLGLADEAVLDMGGFAGGLFKYLRRNPVRRLSLVLGFAKGCKLAGGAMDLHSRASRVDFDRLADMAAALGADTVFVESARGANTAAEVLAMARGAGIPLGDEAARRAKGHALRALDGAAEVEVLLIDRNGEAAGRA